MVATEAFVPRSFMHRGHHIANFQLAMRDESIVSDVGKALTSFTLAAGLFVSPVFAADAGLKSTLREFSTTSNEKPAAPAAPKSSYKADTLKKLSQQTKVATPAPAPAPVSAPKAYVIDKDTALLEKIAAVKKTTLPPVVKSAPAVLPKPAVTAAPVIKKTPSAPAARLLPEEVSYCSHSIILQHLTILTHPLDHLTSLTLLSYTRICQVAVNAAIDKKASDKAKLEQLKSDTNTVKKQADGYRNQVRWSST